MNIKKTSLVVSVLLVLAMLFSSLTLASAANTEVTAYESTTGSYDDGYNDGYDSGYNDGYYDGIYDGYDNGYNDGYYYGQASNKDIFTVIRERIEEIRYNIQNFFKNLKKKFKDAFGISDIDKNYLPSADTVNLGENEEAWAICEEFNEKTYALYYPDEPISYVKTEKVDIEITDCPGGKVTAALVNPVVKNFLVDEVEEYKNEIDYTTAMQRVDVYPTGLTSAKKTVNDDGTTDYEFVLIDEATFYDGEDDYYLNSNGELSYGYFYNYDVADVLIFNYLDLDPVKVKRATVYYPGTTVKATADAEGRLITLDILMPVEGSGRAQLYLAGLNVEVKGYRNESFEITYPGFDFDIDTDLIPDEQETLEGNEDAAALCEEFEKLLYNFSYGVPDDATIKYENTIDATVTDCPGGSTVASIINPVIDNFTGTNRQEEIVSKGDYSYYVTPIDLFPEGLTVAEKTVNADGTTDYKFVLVNEVAHFDGNRTYAIKYVDGKAQVYDLYHEAIYRQIRLEYVDLGPVTISKADIYYHGATITAKTDAEGRLIGFTLNHPVEGYATGKAGFIQATIGLAGVETENIEITYS